MQNITERKSIDTSQRIFEAARILAMGIIRARRRKAAHIKKSLDFPSISSINLSIPSVHGGQI